MIGPIIAVVGSGSVALNSGVVGVQAAHTVADSFIQVDDSFMGMPNNGTKIDMEQFNINTTHTNSTLVEPTPLYRYAEVNGTGSTLPDSVYTQVPVYQDETTRGQPYEASHSSVCEGDCANDDWTPRFLSEDLDKVRIVRDHVAAASGNRTTVPAPTVTEDFDIEVDDEDKNFYNYVEAAPKNSTEVIEAMIAGQKAAAQLKNMHGKGTSTGMPSTTEDLLKSEKQLRKEYEAEKDLLKQLGA